MTKEKKELWGRCELTFDVSPEEEAMIFDADTSDAAIMALVNGLIRSKRYDFKEGLILSPNKGQSRAWSRSRED